MFHRLRKRISSDTSTAPRAMRPKGEPIVTPFTRQTVLPSKAKGLSIKAESHCKTSTKVTDVFLPCSPYVCRMSPPNFTCALDFAVSLQTVTTRCLVRWATFAKHSVRPSTATVGRICSYAWPASSTTCVLPPNFFPHFQHLIFVPVGWVCTVLSVCRAVPRVVYQETTLA